MGESRRRLTRLVPPSPSACFVFFSFSPMPGCLRHITRSGWCTAISSRERSFFSRVRKRSESLGKALRVGKKWSERERRRSSRIFFAVVDMRLALPHICFPFPRKEKELQERRSFVSRAALCPCSSVPLLFLSRGARSRGKRRF